MQDPLKGDMYCVPLPPNRQRLWSDGTSMDDIIGGPNWDFAKAVKAQMAYTRSYVHRDRVEATRIPNVPTLRRRVYRPVGFQDGFGPIRICYDTLSPVRGLQYWPYRQFSEWDYGRAPFVKAYINTELEHVSVYPGIHVPALWYLLRNASEVHLLVVFYDGTMAHTPAFILPVFLRFCVRRLVTSYQAGSRLGQ